MERPHPRASFIVPTPPLLASPSSGGGFRSVNGGGIGGGAIPSLMLVAPMQGMSRVGVWEYLRKDSGTGSGSG